MAIIFETTFNVPEWDNSMGVSDAQLAPAGDGISGNLAQTTANGNRAQVTSAANHSAGGGGRGHRNWLGDGVNNHSGGINIEYAGRTELWFRYYIRYPSGFQWGASTFHKQWYNQGSGAAVYFGLHGGLVGGHIENDPTNGGIRQSSVSWSDYQGGSTGDGQFHCLEWHLKMNTGIGTSDGMFECWLDGTQICSFSNVHYSDDPANDRWNHFFTSNANAPSNSNVDQPIDYDDLVISDSSYIGPLSGGGGPGIALDSGGWSIGQMTPDIARIARRRAAIVPRILRRSLALPLAAARRV